METKSWKEIKNSVYGKKGTERRDELERDFESFKIGLLLRNAREGKNLTQEQLGELIDKITILQIKDKHLQGAGLENVKKELEELEKTLNNLQLNINPNLIQRLKEVNQDLWQIEDDIRDQERRKNFGETFIRLARSVYQQNDLRAAIKKEINTTYGSALVEEKSYKQY